MRRKSLRIQITAAVGIIVTLACLALTANSIYSANNYYAGYLEDQSSSEAMVPPPGTYEEDFPERDGQIVADITRSFSVQGVAAMALAILACVLFAWWACGRLLRPLEELTGRIHAVDQEKLNQPLPIPGGTAEVRLLAESFNGMLDRLNQSFQMQRRFAADAAHELKTPLAAMKTTLQVLQMEEAPSKEEYQEFVQDTQESLERLICTVENLLALASREARNDDEPVSLKSLTLNVARGLEPKAAVQHITVSVEGEEAVAKGSPALFYRAIYNVIENAIKYNHPGGQVQARVMKSNNGQAAITVTDTGIGIPQESMESIFEPFYRADPSRSQKIEGSGLGLSIVRQIMEQYGGSVTVEDSNETGSTIVLRFICLDET